MVFVEQFTNTRCGICAARNPQFEATRMQYTDDIVHIKYHIGSPYPNCFFYSQNRDEQNTRRDHRAVQGTPTAIVQGQRVNGTNPLLPESRILEVRDEVAALSIDLIYEAGGVRAVVANHGVNSSEDLKIWIAIVEDNVEFDAPNGEDIHSNVFRRFVSDPSGEEFTLDGSEVDLGVWDYMLDSDWNESEVDLIAWVETSSGEVLNATIAQQSISSNEELVSFDQLSVFPNPAQSIVTISIPSFTERVSVFSITGKELMSEEVIAQSGEHLIDISSLPKGTYIVRAEGNNQRQTVRLLK